MKLGCPHCRSVFEVPPRADTAQCPACGFQAALPVAAAPPPPSWGPVLAPPPATASEWLPVETDAPVTIHAPTPPPPAPVSSPIPHGPLYGAPARRRGTSKEMVLAVAAGVLIAIVAAGVVGYQLYERYQDAKKGADVNSNGSVVEQQQAIEEHMATEQQIVNNNAAWTDNVDVVMEIYDYYEHNASLDQEFDYYTNALEATITSGGLIVDELSGLTAPAPAARYHASRMDFFEATVEIARDWRTWWYSTDFDVGDQAAEDAVAGVKGLCAKTNAIVTGITDIENWYRSNGREAYLDDTQVQASKNAVQESADVFCSL